MCIHAYSVRVSRLWAQGEEGFHITRVSRSATYISSLKRLLACSERITSFIEDYTVERRVLIRPNAKSTSWPVVYTPVGIYNCDQAFLNVYTQWQVHRLLSFWFTNYIPSNHSSVFTCVYFLERKCFCFSLFFFISKFVVIRYFSFLLLFVGLFLCIVYHRTSAKFACYFSVLYHFSFAMHIQKAARWKFFRRGILSTSNIWQTFFIFIFQ